MIRHEIDMVFILGVILLFNTMKEIWKRCFLIMSTYNNRKVIRLLHALWT